MTESIVLDRPGTAFRERRERWESDGGAWRVELVVERAEALPKYQAVTVSIYKRNVYTRRFCNVGIRKLQSVPQNVLSKYDEFISLANEVR